MSASSMLLGLPTSGRLALSLLLLVNLGGFIAASFHLETHHQNRDERPGLSVDDLTGAYHGIRSQAPLRLALERNHPGEIDGSKSLDPSQKKRLLDWLDLDSVKMGEQYDSLDLGENAPAEILAAACVKCHSRGSTDAAAKKLPLEYLDDVKPIATSRDISPTDEKIMIASLHTHAISLATILILLTAMMFATRWPTMLRGGLPLLAALGLSVDLACWLLARSSPAFVYGIIAGGALFVAATGLMTLALVVDMWLPEAGKREL